MSNKVETPFHHILTAFVIHMVLLSKLCFYSIAKTYIYIYYMQKGISCTGNKKAIQLEVSLLHNHKLLLCGIKCLAVNQKSKSKTQIACRNIFELIDASAISTCV